MDRRLPGPQVGSSWALVGRVDELKGPGPFARSAGDADLVVIRTPVGFRAFEGRCPHQGALLGEGELDGDTLVCRNHRWRFNLGTGQRQGGPQCLAACPVEIRGEDLWADLAALDPVPAPDRAPTSAPRQTLRDLTGPRRLPIVGNLHQIRIDRLHLVLEQWARKYGPLYTYRMGPNRVVAVADPALSEQVLRARPETFRGGVPTIEPVFAEMGVSGVFSAEGPWWRPQRRLAMEALSHKHLRGFYPTLRTVMDRLLGRWQRQAEAGATLDFAEECKRFTVDVTTALVLGYDINTIGQGDDVIQRQLEQIFPAFNRRLFALLPTWRWIRRPADRALDRALGQLHQWLGGLLAEARARMAVDPGRAERPANFLESMLAAHDAEGRPFADRVILGNAITMLVAGEDTTAYTLAWAVHQLADAPAAVARLRAEAEGVLGAEPVPPDLDAVNRLAYAGAVANETMRLRPVAPLLLFEANRDAVIGDLAIPRGTWVALLTRPPVLESRHFVDPTAFQPDRWLADASGERAHEPAAHIPFGSGPRICPGRTLALVEMKALLATLYRNFEVERLGPAEGVAEQWAFAMMPAGLRVRLTRRPAG